MKIQAVIFDWAGTVVDYGCHAPPATLIQVFEKRGVSLTPAESRHAMGLLKIDQIREILNLPRVRQAWSAMNGGEAPVESDVRDLFDQFVPLQMDLIEAHSTVIAGVPELVEKLRSRGVRIGSTTGYTRAMLDRLIPLAAKQGYAPDVIVTPDDTGFVGRPHPWMIFENLRRLNVYPPQLCVKVGDTPSDVEEGRNAGVRTIGVCESSNEAVLAGPEGARAILETAGAEAVVGTSPDIWSLLEEM
jgi:phosphonoacetaldehyde hydrolase